MLICDSSDNIVTSGKPYLAWRAIIESNYFSSTHQPIDDECVVLKTDVESTKNKKEKDNDNNLLF